MEKDPNTALAFLEGLKASHWMLFGIGLGALELMTGSTYILWPAVAAIIVAAGAFLLPLTWQLQVLLFVGLSLVLLVLGHYYVRPMSKSGEPQDLNDPSRTMVGLRVKAVSDFEIGRGRVQVADTQWGAAMHEGNAKAGDELRVTEVKGTTLWVEPV